jgi:hypothetical protein
LECEESDIQNNKKNGIPFKGIRANREIMSHYLENRAGLNKSARPDDFFFLIVEIVVAKTNMKRSINYT